MNNNGVNLVFEAEPHEFDNLSTIVTRIISIYTNKNKDWSYSSIFEYNNKKQKKIINFINKKLQLTKEEINSVKMIEDFYSSYRIFEYSDFILVIGYKPPFTRQHETEGIFVISSLEKIHQITDIIHMMKWIEPVEKDKDKNSINIIEYLYDKKNKSIIDNISEKNVNDFKQIYENLYPEVNIELLIQEYIKSDENILVLMGEPWTWKTTFLKYLMKYICENELTSDIAYIKDEHVLQDEEFWARMTDYKDGFIILDDMDNWLTPRTKKDKESMNFVNKLLSYSDWLFEVKTKIIITTNMMVDEIDSAITRPWRCFDILKFRPLSIENAKSIWEKELHMKDFDKVFKTKLPTWKISQAELMTKFKDIKYKNITRKYLKDNSISLKD